MLGRLQTHLIVSAIPIPNRTMIKQQGDEEYPVPDPHPLLIWFVNKGQLCSNRIYWLAADTAYKWALRNGLAKEQARAVLPEGNTVSRLYMNGTLRSWVHYIELRRANGTQKEHVKIAEECLQAILPVFSLLEDIYV